jgi:pyridoxine kinase
MNKTTKILTIQDISCYGQCSITVALPVISAFGIETAVLPSAVLSTHTSGFTDFTVRDLTEDLPEIRKHWEKEGISFDAIYTGFIASQEQLDYIKDIIDSRLKDEGLVFVDPAMADHGKLYPGFDEFTIIGMKDLVSVADYIIPNITEACFITGNSYEEIQDDDYINKLLQDLYQLGAKNIILTSAQDDLDSIGVISYDGLTKTTIMKEKIEKNYHGTGDIFSSLVVAGILNGKDIKDNLNFATDFITDSIDITLDDPYHEYAPKYEQILKRNIK